MKIANVDPTWFKDEASMKLFFLYVEQMVKSANGEPVPVVLDDKVIAYITSLK